jgi:hypothetical protein
MGAGEAYQAWCREWAGGCLRVLRPGAHLAAFGSPRTAHRLVCGLEEAGFELRDTLIWLYGTGLPKSRKLPDGCATSLKPAYEPILLARRAPEAPLGRNLETGAGALNADPCRVEGRFPPMSFSRTHRIAGRRHASPAAPPGWWTPRRSALACHRSRCDDRVASSTAPAPAEPFACSGTRGRDEGRHDVPGRRRRCGRRRDLVASRCSMIASTDAPI